MNSMHKMDNKVETTCLNNDSFLHDITLQECTSLASHQSYVHPHTLLTSYTPHTYSHRSYQYYIFTAVCQPIHHPTALVTTNHALCTHACLLYILHFTCDFLRRSSDSHNLIRSTMCLSVK